MGLLIPFGAGVLAGVAYACWRIHLKVSGAAPGGPFKGAPPSKAAAGAAGGAGAGAGARGRRRRRSEDEYSANDMEEGHHTYAGANLLHLGTYVKASANGCHDLFLKYFKRS